MKHLKQVKVNRPPGPDGPNVRITFSILSIPYHSLAGEFVLLSSGQHYSMAVYRSNRRLKSFVPPAVQVLNQRYIVGRGFVML